MERDWEAYNRVKASLEKAEASNVEVDTADLQAVIEIIEGEFGVGEIFEHEPRCCALQLSDESMCCCRSISYSDHVSRETQEGQ